MDICAWQWCVDWSKVLDVIVTLAAAFGGAWAAFGFERWQARRDQDERRIGAANRALYTIFNLWNIQEQYRKEIIEPYRNSAGAWLNMAATPPSAYGVTTFDAGELSFLLEGDSMIYAAILLEEQRFGHTIKMIDVRSGVMLNEAWRSLAANGVAIGEQRDEQYIERAIGIDVVRKLKVMTEGVVNNVDRNLETLMSAQEELRNAMRRRYPGAKFLRMESKPTEAKPL